MRIIVDAMGGDNAPREIVAGALSAVSEFGAEITLVGRGEEILQALKDQGESDLPKGIGITHASEVIGMEDDPSGAVREKKDSSIVVGLELLAKGEGEAFVSAGSTGALLSASTLVVKRIKGIRRAALAPVIPTSAGGALLIDCGANVECTPEYIMQFALMGAHYATHVMGRENPRVGLLNIGSEETKGTPLHRESYLLLEKEKEAGRLIFTGNVEGRDVFFGEVDVVVADGFSGNILLKTLEGAGMYFASILKGMFTKNLGTKLAAALVKPGLREFKKLLDYTETGGAPLLGIAKPVIKAHGSSNAKAIRGAVRQAMLFAQTGIIEDIAKSAGAARAGEDVSE